MDFSARHRRSAWHSDGREMLKNAVEDSYFLRFAFPGRDPGSVRVCGVTAPIRRGCSRTYRKYCAVTDGSACQIASDSWKAYCGLLVCPQNGPAVALVFASIFSLLPWERRSILGVCACVGAGHGEV